jgi:hypothetical protein
MGLISDGTTVFDAGVMASGFGSSMVFIKKLTASSSATLSFVNGASGVVLDNTYKEYIFTFNNMHPASNDVVWRGNFSIDGGSNYNVAKTTTYFYAAHDEADSTTAVSYRADDDVHGTGDYGMAYSTGNGNDESVSGYMHLFDPSSTTFVKHFTARLNNYVASNYTLDHHIAGYVNSTSAVNAAIFKFSSGNIDAGDICLYGIR